MRMCPCLLWLACAATSWAQDSASLPRPDKPPDEIYATAQAEDLSPGSSGAGLGVGWLHRVSARAAADLAVFSQGVEDTRWTYVRAQGFAWLGERIHLRAGAGLGSGEREGEPLPYRRVWGGVGALLVPGRLFVEVESQYVDFAELRGHLLRPEVVAFIQPFLSLRAGYHFSTSADLDTDAFSLRVDLHRASVSPFAGLSFGRNAGGVLDLEPGLTIPVSSQIYAGFRAPLGRHAVVLFAELARADDLTRFRVSVLLRIRI